MHLVSLIIHFARAVSVISDRTRLSFSLAVRATVSATSDIAHIALLARADSSIVVEGGDASLPMEAFDLQLAKLDIEIGNEVLEDVSAFGHELRRLLVRQYFLYVLLGLLKVGEEENEDFPGVARDLHQIDCVVDLMEVSVEDLATHLDATFIEADGHGRRSLLGHDVDLVRS